MKFLKLFFILALASQAFSAQAGEEDNRNIRIDFAIPFNLGIAFDFQISEKLTLGPEFSTRFLGEQRTPNSEVTSTLQSLGARANWYKNGVHSDGFYAGSSLKYSKMTLTTRNGIGVQTIDSENGLSISGIAGYGWFWSSFNMLLGGGAELSLQKPSIDYLDSNNILYRRTTPSSRLLIEYTLGWSF